MSGDFLGGGIVFAIAAALWIAYLIPSWLRRRHFATTEATTVRMKHTVAAMSARGRDTSALIEAEATARAVHEQKKILRKLEKQSRRSDREAARASLSPEQRLLLARHRRKNQRLGALVFLLLSLATVAAGVAVIAYLGDILLLVMGILMTFTALVIQRALGRTVKLPRQESVPKMVHTVPVASASPAVTGWTPQPLPRPLQSAPDSASARTIARAQAAEEQRRALAQQQYLDSLEQSKPVETATSQFAKLGIIDEMDGEAFNLDEALRRRRVG